DVRHPRPAGRARHRHRAGGADGGPRRRRPLLHRPVPGRVRDRPGAGRPQRRDRRDPSPAAHHRRHGQGGAARADGAARRPPDAAAGRGPDHRGQALDPRAPLQRRVGVDDAAGAAVTPVRRHGRRIPARAQGRPGAGGRTHPALHEGRGIAGPSGPALLLAAPAGPAAGRRQHRRAAGADRARPVARRHAAVQAERVRRLRHR
ncbi:MAG: Phosphoenolpyruvate-protein phosphotransferase of PTS system, partial [uncultured Ramlibacter sp.]